MEILHRDILKEREGKRGEEQVQRQEQVSEDRQGRQRAENLHRDRSQKDISEDRQGDREQRSYIGIP